MKIMNYKLLVGSVFLVLAACGDSTKPVAEVSDSTNVSISVQTSNGETNPEMVLFQNMEMVSYCALIPMKEYERSTQEMAKAKHVFVHKTKKNNEIEIQGLLRSDTSVPLETYYEESLKDSELEGKVIEKKELLKDKNCFYAKGYWSNSINESRFIEVCWLREGEVVKYSSFFDIADTAIWNNHLQVIVESGVDCK